MQEVYGPYRTVKEATLQAKLQASLEKDNYHDFNVQELLSGGLGDVLAVQHLYRPPVEGQEDRPAQRLRRYNSYSRKPPD